MTRSFAVLLLAVTLSACTSSGHHKACDEPALERAVASFEANSGADPATRELLDGLLSACPTFHRGLLRDLELTYLGGGPDQKLLLLSDQDYLDERKQACVDPKGWSERVPRLPPDQRARGMFEICELARFGLLEPGEPFLADDLAAFLANDWLMRHGVETSLGRRLARGLMFVSADEPLSLQRCLRDHGSPACATVIRRGGAGLPASSADAWVDPSGSATLVFLSEAATMVAATPVTADASLRILLAEEAGKQARLGSDWSRELLIVADRQTSWADVMEVLHVASENGWTDSSLLVERGDELAQLPIRARMVWPIDMAAEQASYARLAPVSGPPELVVGEQAIRLPDGDGTLARADIDELEPLARRLAKPRGRPYVTVRAAPTVELQAVVEVIDALRGRECSLAKVHEDGVDEPTEDCALWWPTVDLDPPIPRRTGDWSRLQLSLAAPEPGVWGKRKGPVSESRLRENVEQSLDGIRQCLIESPRARVYMHEQFSFTFGTLEGRRLGARVFAPYSDELPQTCMLDALGLPAVPDEMLGPTAFVDVGVVIEVPD